MPHSIGDQVRQALLEVAKARKARDGAGAERVDLSKLAASLSDEGAAHLRRLIRC